MNRQLMTLSGRTRPLSLIWRLQLFGRSFHRRSAKRCFPGLAEDAYRIGQRVARHFLSKRVKVLHVKASPVCRCGAAGNAVN